MSDEETSFELPEGYILQESADPAEMMIGPFCKQPDQPVTAFRPRPEHGNSLGIVHGGILMTFADFTFCNAGLLATGDSDCLTVNLNCNFVSGAPIDSWIHGEATVRQVTGRMIFADGLLTADGATLLTFSGIGRRVHASGDKQ